jgi:signal transduction histidine kinase
MTLVGPRPLRGQRLPSLVPEIPAMHRLLKRQLDRHASAVCRDGAVPEELRAFIDAVDEAYQESDTDRAMLERSLELSSQELLQANSDLRAVFQAFPDLFFRLDSTGVILERKGGDTDDPYLSDDRNLKGKRIQDIPVRDVAERFERAITQVAREGKFVSVEYSLQVRGRERYYEARLLPIQQDRLMAIIRNITDRKDAERAVADKAKELARSNAELEQFAYVASHDLQEPLRTVQSYLQLIERRYVAKLDADGKAFIGFAVDGAKRMRQLINDLLAYARVSSRAKPFESTELAELVDQVLASMAATIRERGAVVTREALPRVQVDRAQMFQLYQNLVSNALKFTRDCAPRIHLSSARQGDEWRLGVSDNGIGIDPAYADQVFEIFKRLHSAEEYEGTGIGLAICKKIVERHGGRIWVESQPGQGSTFCFTLLVGERMVGK